MMFRLAVSALLSLVASAVSAVECENVSFENNRYTICEVDPQAEDLRLFLDDETGNPYGQFSRLDSKLNARALTLEFAMNAGMYHPDRSPVGYYKEGEETRRGLITSASAGNFGLLPNGVFCIAEGRAEVFETLLFEALRPSCRFASQSGPMLVIDGALHPRFLRDSTSRYLRNGVGTSSDGSRVVFAISNNPVTFYQFGRLFQSALSLPNALYFDGNVSRLHAPKLGRSDIGRAMGPIVGVVGRQ